jgi:hypothetical protein
MLMLLAFLSLATAQAAEPTETLTLACEGTTTWRLGQNTPEKSPISMGIIANFTGEDSQGFHGTVEGLEGIRGKIFIIDETKIIFSGTDEKLGSIQGSIDRVTGAVSAVRRGRAEVEGLNTDSVYYVLKCKPTQRMF